MDVVAVVLRLRDRWIWVVPALIVAVALGVSTKYSIFHGFKSKVTSSGLADAQLLVDTRQSTLGSLAASTNDDELDDRAPLYAEYGATGAVTPIIARYDGISPSQLSVTADTSEVSDVGGPTVSTSYNNAPDPKLASRQVTLTASDNLPIIDVTARAETARAAVSLANAAVAGLRVAVSRLDGKQHPSRVEALTLRSLGVTQGGESSYEPSTSKAILYALVAFVVLLLVILLGDYFWRAREPRTDTSLGRRSKYDDAAGQDLLGSLGVEQPGPETTNFGQAEPHEPISSPSADPGGVTGPRSDLRLPATSPTQAAEGPVEGSSEVAELEVPAQGLAGDLALDDAVAGVDSGPVERAAPDSTAPGGSADAPESSADSREATEVPANEFPSQPASAPAQAVDGDEPGDLSPTAAFGDEPRNNDAGDSPVTEESGQVELRQPTPSSENLPDTAAAEGSGGEMTELMPGQGDAESFDATGPEDNQATETDHAAAAPEQPPNGAESSDQPHVEEPSGEAS